MAKASSRLTYDLFSVEPLPSRIKWLIVGPVDVLRKVIYGVRSFIIPDIWFRNGMCLFICFSFDAISPLRHCNHLPCLRCGAECGCRAASLLRTSSRLRTIHVARMGTYWSFTKKCTPLCGGSCPYCVPQISNIGWWRRGQMARS